MGTALYDPVESEIREGERSDFSTPSVHVRQGADDQVVVEITNDQLDRHGTIIDPEGARLEDYKENPVVLWRHGHGMDGIPIARSTNIQVRGTSIFAEVEFNEKMEQAQVIEQGVRDGFINAASIGFIPHTINREDDDPVIAEWTLLEWSFVGVPSNPGALVSEREMEVFGPVIEQVAERKLEEMMAGRKASEDTRQEHDWRVGGTTELEVIDDEEWDAQEATDAVFELAEEGEEVDTDLLRRGHFVYDAEADGTAKAHYKLPYAKTQDGELVASARGIETVDSFLGQTEGITGAQREDIAGMIRQYREASDALEDPESENEGPEGEQREESGEAADLRERIEWLCEQVQQLKEGPALTIDADSLEGRISGEDLIYTLEQKSSDSERSAPDRDDTVADSSTDPDEREAADEAAERSSEEVGDEAASEGQSKLVRLKLSDMKAMAREAHRRRESRAERMAENIYKRLTGKA